MPEKFDPEGNGYDYQTAKKAGMGQGDDGHWGSVAPVSDEEREKFGLPDEAYVLLKGRSHETWDKAVAAENKRGFAVVKLGNRYYSVPRDWQLEE